MSSPISTILANLRRTVNILRSAVYAIDVRDDIADAIDDSADAIEQIYSDVDSASLREDAFAAALQEAIDDNLLPIPATVIDDNSLPGTKIQDGTIPLRKLSEAVQITVDSALSGTSTNPVQNKVIKETIDELNGSLNNEYSYGLVDEKEGMSISITTEQKKSLINVNANGVTTQDGIPTPESPIEYVGYGELQENGTYSVSISVTDANGDAHTIIASGLSSPIYEGDYVDFVNGKVVRRMKELQLKSFSSFNILYGRGKIYGGVTPVITTNGPAKCNIATRATNVDNAFSVYSSMCKMVILYGTSEDTTEESMISKFENAKFLLPLYTPIEESITLSEDVSTHFGELTLSGDSTITVKYRADIKTYIAEQIQAIAISMTEGYMSLGEE